MDGDAMKEGLKTHDVREQVWQQLRHVALPDSRFNLDFAEYIPDFEGSAKATDRITGLDALKESRFAFITPDNCLTELRRRMIAQRKTFVMSTYGIYRGFVLIEPGMVPEGAELYAAWLDGMEHFGKPVSLAEIKAMGAFDLMVTGASAVSTNGVRFGKGHGFFDLEWGMFTDIGVAEPDTTVIALVHDCQLIKTDLERSETDIIVDLVATPDVLHKVSPRAERPSGVKWELLDHAQIDATPPLQELKAMQRSM
jgi:5-formyltetrahydrofolate cyclo-ligase